MAKTFYYFNTKTLSFEKAQFSFKDIIKRVLWLAATALSFALLVLWLSFYLIDSPKEKMLQRENNELKEVLQKVNQKLDVMEIVLNDIQDRDDNVYRTILEAEPVPIEKRNPYFIENKQQESILISETEKLLKIIESKTEKLIFQLAVEKKSIDTLLVLANSKNEMLLAIPAIRPIKNMYNITSGFGMRYHPILKTLRQHTGIDITAPKGTPVYATADGVVSHEKAQVGYGTTVILNHGYSYQTLYGHLSKKAVKPGQKVKRGELIGYVGSTGLSLGAHLHYEVIKNGIPVNPVYFFIHDITPQEYDVILESSRKINQALS